MTLLIRINCLYTGESFLTQDDIIRREVITDLMCNFRLKKERVEKKFNIDFDTYFREALDHLGSLQEDGLVELAKDQIRVTNSGRLLIRNIAMKFDYHLMKKEKDKPQFSRTV